MLNTCIKRIYNRFIIIKMILFLAVVPFIMAACDIGVKLAVIVLTKLTRLAVGFDDI